ncbi:hypothetical protein C7999DRAFT_12955 [Corynascus novoguineensis]|uniref:Zn(2)-C6 fungal-type domain-containing protein n=1 Tax=Corynascus novoguineensis TaxID=1126955 RepID=A0AAN7CW62_9PEZI|nr:hypothetical protein C7999DRAFT_12955 [Corynascus novoguineensis]
MEPGPEQLSRHASGHARALLSCNRCRSRKLKCDRNRPRCDRCVKQDEPCNYPGSRQRGLGPRKSVRELEQRIAAPMGPGVPNLPEQPAGQLISLGLFEQLPSFDIIDNLTALYFQNVHDGAPMLHQGNYTLALRLPFHMRPPMCLQYIVMALAAATSDLYRHLSEPFYQRARVYAEADEMRRPGEIFATVAHAQCWCLIAAYECHVYAMYTRASTSLCRSVRVAQMLNLHKLDSEESERLQSGLPPPRNWIEVEERRRTWWVIFLADCFLAAVTGWSSLIDERHIRTHLPSTEEYFNTGIGGGLSIPFSRNLDELRQGGPGSQLSPLAARILAANELLQTLDHTSKDSTSAHRRDMQGAPYWQRLRQIDANLVTLAAALPETLDPSRNPHSLDAILVHTCTHMATIHLHRTALRRHRQPVHAPSLVPAALSHARLLPAAEGILAVFHAAGAFLGAALQNPLLPFAAYLAASVFLENHVRPSSSASLDKSSEEKLGYLARVLVAFGRSSPLVRVNALQLAADMRRVGHDASAIEIERALGLPERMRSAAAFGGMVFCPPLAASIAPDVADGWVVAGEVGNGTGVFPMLSVCGLVKSGPCTPSSTVVPSMLKAGAPDGLFSKIESCSGAFSI